MSGEVGGAAVGWSAHGFIDHTIISDDFFKR